MESISSAVRVAILIDGSNIYKTALRLGVRVDYSKVLERLNGRQIVRAILYQPDVVSEKQEGFIRKMKSMGFEVRTKEVKVYPDGKRKADMDVDLTIDAVCLADKVDVICIVSMDGDYVPLVHYLKSRGVKVEAMGFERCVSGDLRRAVDEFHAISEEMFLASEHGGWCKSA